MAHNKRLDFSSSDGGVATSKGASFGGRRAGRYSLLLRWFKSQNQISMDHWIQDPFQQKNQKEASEFLPANANHAKLSFREILSSGFGFFIRISPPGSEIARKSTSFGTSSIGC